MLAGAGKMDVRTDARHIPLCVDLDGTLLATDTLWEGVAVVLMRTPFLIFSVVWWALRGKGRVMHEFAARARLASKDWPYREPFLHRL